MHAEGETTEEPVRDSDVAIARCAAEQLFR
jgi:hypothetical protein